MHLRSIALVVASFAVALASVETGFFILERVRPGQRAYTTSYSGRYYIGDSDLGYAVAPGAQVKARRAGGDRVIYDAVYTIADKGRRFTRGDRNGDTWVFMGCSRTFGEGVNDDETLPAFFSAALGHQANVVNAGLHGYGPHQMLRLLETDRLGDLRRPAKHVIYQGLPEHVRRAAGRAAWDLSGPHYSIDGDSVSYTGPHHGSRFIAALNLLQKSAAARFFIHRLYFDADPTDEEIERYGRIVERAASLSREKLGAPFTVLFWDGNSRAADRVLARLSRSGIPVVRVSRLLPRNEWKALEIPLDPHPSPEAYRRIATGLAAYFRLAEGRPATRRKADTGLYLKGDKGAIQPPGTVQAGR